MSADKLDIATFLLSSIHDMKNSLGMMAAYLEDALATPEAGAVDTPARRKPPRRWMKRNASTTI